MANKNIQEWLYWFIHKKQLNTLHAVFRWYAFVFVVWGLYRLWFTLPILIEEGVLKGFVFGLPVLLGSGGFAKMSLTRMGIRGDNLFQSVYLGLGLGIMFGLVGQLVNIIRNGSLILSPYITSEQVGGFLLLGLVTAFWEELLFAGFILQRLKTVMEEWRAVVTTALLFALLHIPAIVFVQKLPFIELLISGTLLFVLALGNGILMLRMKNLIAPILVHLVWGMTIFLFR